jgi:uncharacterized protein YacL
MEKMAFLIAGINLFVAFIFIFRIRTAARLLGAAYLTKMNVALVLFIAVPLILDYVINTNESLSLILWIISTISFSLGMLYLPEILIDGISKIVAQKKQDALTTNFDEKVATIMEKQRAKRIKPSEPS